VTEKIASTIDVLPTVAAATGAQLPANTIDGVNLLPVLYGDVMANPRNTFLYYYEGQLRAVREGKWKRVYQHRTRSYVGVEAGNDGHPGPYTFPTVPNALYDLEADIGETTDLSSSYPDVVQRLDSLAERARESLGDGLTQHDGREVRPPGRRGFDRPDTMSHLAVGAAVTMTTPLSSAYPGNGPSSLTDGRLGSRDFHDQHWLGFEEDDLDAVVDLGELRDVRRIGLDCLRNQVSWIFFPQTIEFAVSVDGSDWRIVHQDRLTTVILPESGTHRFSADLETAAIRFVRVRARNLGLCPDWHVGAGGKAWLFVDEIVIE